MVCNHISLPEGRTDSYLFSSTLSSSCCLNVCEYKSVHFWWPVCCLTFDSPNPVLPVASTPSRWCLASKWHQNRCFYFNNLRGTFYISHSSDIVFYLSMGFKPRQNPISHAFKIFIVYSEVVLTYCHTVWKSTVFIVTYWNSESEPCSPLCLPTWQADVSQPDGASLPRLNWN